MNKSQKHNTEYKRQVGSIQTTITYLSIRNPKEHNIMVLNVPPYVKILNTDNNATDHCCL